MPVSVLGEWLCQFARALSKPDLGAGNGAGEVVLFSAEPLCTSMQCPTSFAWCVRWFVVMQLSQSVSAALPPTITKGKLCSPSRRSVSAGALRTLRRIDASMRCRTYAYARKYLPPASQRHAGLFSKGVWVVALATAAVDRGNGAAAPTRSLITSGILPSSASAAR